MSIKAHQVLAQVAFKQPFYRVYRGPKADGENVGSWTADPSATLSTTLNWQDEDFDSWPDPPYPEYPLVGDFVPTKKVYKTDPSVGDHFDLQLAPMTEPPVRFLHVIKVHVGSPIDNSKFYAYVDLYEGNPASGGTLIWGYALDPQATAIWFGTRIGGAGNSYSISVPEFFARNISNYGNLWLRFRIAWADGGVADPQTCEVYWLSLQLPTPMPAIPDFIAAPAAPFEPHVSPETGLVITINDNPIGTFDPQTASIEDGLSERGIASFTVNDWAVARDIPIGARVKIRFNGILLFGGTVNCIEENYPGDGQTRMVQSTYECTDLNALLDRRIVAASYTDVTLSDVVEDILTNQCPELLSQDNLNIGTLPDTMFFEDVRFNYRTVAECFSDLASAAGLAWKVSPSGVINFYDRSTNYAPFEFGDKHGTDYRWRSLVYRRDREGYRNAQWLLGGFMLTDLVTERFFGDPNTIDVSKRKRVFGPLRYPLGEIEFPAGLVHVVEQYPRIWRVSGGVSTEQRVGIRGVDDEDDVTFYYPDPGHPLWAHWFVRKGDKEISQNQADDEVNNPHLTSPDYIEITYRGQVPMVVYENDAAEIAVRATAESGSGIYEAIDQDEQLNGRDLGLERAQMLLARYGRIPNVLQIGTFMVGLLPGQLMSCTFTRHGIDGIQFMVDAISISFPTADDIVVDVSMFDGVKQSGWSDYWRKVATAGRKFSIRENELVVRSSRPASTVDVSETFTDSVHDTVVLPDTDDDPYTHALWGVVTMASGEIIPKLLVGRSTFGASHE